MGGLIEGGIRGVRLIHVAANQNDLRNLLRYTSLVTKAAI